jgi:flagellar biosynthesis protein FliR
MSALKIIAIVVLLSLAGHLLLFSFLRRRINAAKAEVERREG